MWAHLGNVGTGRVPKRLFLSLAPWCLSSFWCPTLSSSLIRPSIHPARAPPILVPAWLKPRCHTPDGSATVIPFAPCTFLLVHNEIIPSLSLGRYVYHQGHARLWASWADFFFLAGWFPDCADGYEHSHCPWFGPRQPTIVTYTNTDQLVLLTTYGLEIIAHECR